MSTPDRDPPGLTVAQAVARTGVGRATIYRAIQNNTLKSHLIAGRRILPVAELDAWNSERRKRDAWLGKNATADAGTG